MPDSVPVTPGGLPQERTRTCPTHGPDTAGSDLPEPQKPWSTKQTASRKRIPPLLVRRVMTTCEWGNMPAAERREGAACSGLRFIFFIKILACLRW